jgi:hypothetical protein
LGKKFVLPVTLLAILLVGCGTASADLLVGVKENSWIEYQVALTGLPPPDHEVVWARMEIKSVQGKIINLNVTTKLNNGTSLHDNVILNLETGQLGDNFIIPANLTTGDTFLDQYHGNITISGVEKRSYAGAKRTVVYASTTHSIYYWDKLTGVLVEGISEFSEYSIHSITEKTNIWQPEIFDLEPIVFFIVLLIATILIIAALAFLRLRKK